MPEDVTSTLEAPTQTSPLEELNPDTPLWELPEITGKAAPEKPVLTSETEKKPETPPEDKKGENPPVQTEEQPVLKGKARENFAKLEEKAKAAEDRANKLQADYEATQAKIKEFEEKLANQPTVNVEEYEKKIQERDQKLQEAQNELRFVAIERDPEFIARYVTPQTYLQGTLKEMALLTGATDKDFERAMTNPEKMEEIRDNLAPAEQRKWDAALLQIEQVNLQKGMALKDRDQTYQQLNEQRQKQYESAREQQRQTNLALARKVAMMPFEAAPHLKEDTELQERVTKVLTGIAGGEGAENWNAEAIMQQVAAAQVQTKILTTQNDIIQAQTKEMEELKKKVEEQESFIKSKFGGMPSNEPDTSKGEKKEEDTTPIWKEVQDMVNGKSNVFV